MKIYYYIYYYDNISLHYSYKIFLLPLFDDVLRSIDEVVTDQVEDDRDDFEQSYNEVDICLLDEQSKTKVCDFLHIGNRLCENHKTFTKAVKSAFLVVNVAKRIPLQNKKYGLFVFTKISNKVRSRNSQMHPKMGLQGVQSKLYKPTKL